MRDNVQTRPTLHLLKGLDEGWTDSCQRRHIVEERWKELHPLARLDHPALAKAVGQFGSDPSDDINKGTISCSGDLHLLKVRKVFRSDAGSQPVPCLPGMRRNHGSDSETHPRRLIHRFRLPMMRTNGPLIIPPSSNQSRQVRFCGMHGTLDQ
ncbi:hypothetical protein [Arthrobacter pigmenti]